MPGWPPGPIVLHSDKNPCLFCHRHWSGEGGVVADSYSFLHSLDRPALGNKRCMGHGQSLPNGIQCLRDKQPKET